MWFEAEFKEFVEPKFKFKPRFHLVCITNMLVTWLQMYHMTRISTNGCSVSGHVALSAILRLYKFCIILTQFYQLLDTGTSDLTNIGLDQLLKCLGLSL